MWPKQNFETGFGDWRNNRGSSMGWSGRNANASGNWKSWQGGSRGSNSSYQKKAATKKPTKQPTKRPLSKTGTKTKAVANKRQKLVSYSKIPLTAVMLVNPGTEASDLPELVFGGFYDCVREAKMGKPRHLLQIDVTKKTEKKKREDATPSADWRVSIPVPTASVEAVSIISGTNPFEKVLKAHSDRISLNNSIEHWNKVISGREAALLKKEDELLNIQQQEEELEEAAKSDIVEDIPEDDGVKDDNADEETVDSSPTKSKSPKDDNSGDSEGDEENWTEDQKKEAKKEELKKKAAKKKETLARKRKFVSSVVNKLTSAVEKAKQSLAREQEKLDKISSELGDELAYFQNEITDEDALSYFKEQLQDGVQSAAEKDNDDVEEVDATNDEEDEEMEAATENLDKSKDSVEVNEDVEMLEAKDKDEGEKKTAVKKEKDKAEKAEKAKKPAEFEKIEDTPVWIIVSLKKPLQKATVTKNSPVSVEDHIQKASMILMKFQPKHKKTIVLKGVTYHGSFEYMKVLNKVLAGPWKALRKNPEELLKSKSPYSLMRTLKYLVMCHTRREVLDNIMEICQLCGKPYKHSAMKKHVTDFCPLREKPCQFCAKVLAVSLMKEHHETECPKYPISCPLKCPKKFARDEMEEHMKVCVNALVDCEFASFGCSKQLKRKELARHLKTAAFEHLSLLKGRVSVLTEYIMKNDPAFKDFMKPACPEPESE